MDAVTHQSAKQCIIGLYGCARESLTVNGRMGHTSGRAGDDVTAI